MKLEHTQILMFISNRFSINSRIIIKGSTIAEYIEHKIIGIIIIKDMIIEVFIEIISIINMNGIRDIDDLG